jgi:predicted kinase
MSTIIIFNGHSGSGKTTLSRKLAEDFSLPLFGRDTFKEIVFDEVGYSDREYSMKVGRAAYEMLYYIAGQMAKSNYNCIIESNFHPVFAKQALDEIMSKTKCHYFQVVCYAPPSMLMSRFVERVEDGSRHPGHADDQRLLEKNVNFETSKIENLDIRGGRFDIDTSENVDEQYDQLVKKLETIL